MHENNYSQLENIKILEKHLEKNEKWLGYPEKKIQTFEKNANEWNNNFKDSMFRIERMIRELERRFEE